MPHLMRHVSNLTDVYNLPCVVAINRFPTDTQEELEYIMDTCARAGIKAVISEAWAEGGKGAEDLARSVVELCDAPVNFRYAYEIDSTIRDKLTALATKIYRGTGIVLTPEAKKQEKQLIFSMR